MITNEYILYTQLASIIGYIVGVFFIYRLLVSQKESTIELLKETNQQLVLKINDLKEQTPDALVLSLTARVEATLGEIERLKIDGENYKGQILEKEKSLNKFADDLLKITQMLKETDLVCPKCNSPQIIRETYTVFGEFNGREADYDAEYIEYECGLSLSDGIEKAPCKNQ